MRAQLEWLIGSLSRLKWPPGSRSNLFTQIFSYFYLFFSISYRKCLKNVSLATCKTKWSNRMLCQSTSSQKPWHQNKEVASPTQHPKCWWYAQQSRENSGSSQLHNRTPRNKSRSCLLCCGYWARWFHPRISISGGKCTHRQLVDSDYRQYHHTLYTRCGQMAAANKNHSKEEKDSCVGMSPPQVVTRRWGMAVLYHLEEHGSTTTNDWSQWEKGRKDMARTSPQAISLSCTGIPRKRLRKVPWLPSMESCYRSQARCASIH